MCVCVCGFIHSKNDLNLYVMCLKGGGTITVREKKISKRKCINTWIDLIKGNSSRKMLKDFCKKKFKTRFSLVLNSIYHNNRMLYLSRSEWSKFYLLQCTHTHTHTFNHTQNENPVAGNGKNVLMLIRDNPFWFYKVLIYKYLRIRTWFLWNKKKTTTTNNR